MNRNPTVAILMATYNGEKFLAEQLDSILAQTYQDFKIYISDDCSTDATLKILQEYQKKFPNRIFYNINKSNMGVVKNFEYLILNAQEKYIALADQDDIWKSTKLELEINKLISIEKNLPAMVHSDLTMIDSDGAILSKSFFNFRKIKLSNTKMLNRIISHNGVMGCTIVFNQQLKDKILPFPNQLDVHDYWIALVAEVIGRRYTIFESLVYYRIHSDNVSNHISKICYKRNIFTRFINNDPLPFRSLNRSEVIEVLRQRFSAKISVNQVNIINAFLSYLRQDKNFLVIFYYLIRYNLIREDISYRVKIFIKLVQFSKSKRVHGITLSKDILKNTKSFLNLKYYNFLSMMIFKKGTFYGWGRKKSGFQAIRLANKYKTSFVLLEDGFIRSVGLGVEGSPSFSLVHDDIGIYYDATVPSRLEEILSRYDFESDRQCLQTAKEAIRLIKKYHISKYNHAPDVASDFLAEDTKKKVLIVAQTAGDASLEYGKGNLFGTHQMIDDACRENPDASVYIKIHPDVLAGKKESDICIEDIPEECMILEKDVNPISLLKLFDKVYTKTSGMGMEALLLGKEVHCYGIPYYAGWGLTQDRQVCHRRTRTLTVESLFAGAYILYTQYHNPYTQKASDIIETIYEIHKRKKML